MITKKSLHSRFIKNWISTLIGIGVIVLDCVMLYQGKLDASEFSLVFGVGAIIAGLKYKSAVTND